MQGSLSAPPLAAAPPGLRPLQGPAATAMGAEQRLDAAEGTDAAAETAPDLPPQPPLVPLQPGISRAQQPQSPQSYVLSGSADPPLAQQARWLLFGLACTVIGGLKLARHLSWLQFSWVILVPAIVLAASLAMVSALPDVYRRQRLFLWAHPLIQLVTLIAATTFRSDADAALAHKAAHKLGAVHGALVFLVNLILLSGLNSALAIFPALQTPPVSTAAAAAVWAASLSATNNRACMAQVMRCPTAAWHMRVLYRTLEPLVAPLEPLLLAAGIGQGHPARHCNCVLAALQFWVIALAIPLLIARGQVKGYQAWRAEQRRLDQQRRRALGETWNFGFHEPSSSSSRSSSEEGSAGVHSPDSPPTMLQEVYARLLQQPTLPPNDLGPAAAAVEMATRPGKPGVRLYQGRPLPRHHSADWQYVWALRTLRTLRPTAPKLAALALCASALGAWHRAAFP